MTKMCGLCITKATQRRTRVVPTAEYHHTPSCGLDKRVVQEFSNYTTAKWKG